MKTFYVAALSCLISTAAFADGPKPITVGESLQVLGALRALDGHQVVVKTANGDAIVNVPWEFKSGALRITIADDIEILSAVEKRQNDARLGILKELLKDDPDAVSIKPDSPKMKEFIDQYQSVLDKDAEGTEKLERIKKTDLKLDINEMPSSILIGLQKILD